MPMTRKMRARFSTLPRAITTTATCHWPSTGTGSGLQWVVGKKKSFIHGCVWGSHWKRRVSRFQPYDLARLCRSEKKWHQAYLYAAQAVQIPYPQQDLLFVDDSVWHWRALDEQAIAAYWTGRFRESGDCCQRLLEQGLLPEAEVQRVRSNLRFAEEKAG